MKCAKKTGLFIADTLLPPYVYFILVMLTVNELQKA